jgi:regulator of protease activity HflC (stomatin/prohibitin superfamily)
MGLIKYEVGKNTYGRETKSFAGFTTTGKVLILAVLAFLFFWIFMFRTVGAGQVGIITRFGEVNRVQTSGIAIKLPFPIERLEKMETRVQKEEQDATAATSDLQDVNGKLALNYALDNETALRVYKELGKDYKDRVVTPAVQESFKAATASFTAQELITKRPEVKAKAYEAIRSRLDKYGIRVVDLNIVNFSFSAQFNQAIEAVQIANQNVAKARQELETTKVQAEKDIAEAQGRAEAQRLQQQTLTPELLQKYTIDAQNRAIDKWNGVLPTTNASGSGGLLFNIPANR